MIVFYEPQCVEWQHEMVNAGMIEFIHQCYPKEKLLYVCEKKQGQNIDKLLKQRNKNIDISYCNYDMEARRLANDDYSMTEFFYHIISDVIDKYKDAIRAFILTSSHRGNMKATYKCAKQTPNLRFVITVHALMESILRVNTCESWLRSKSLISTINELARLSNVDFITFSPLLIGRLGGMLERKSLAKFHFIHHPYQFVDSTKEKDIIEKEINYGIIGACNNNSAKEVVKQVIQNDEVNCNIIIMASDLIKEKDSRIIIVENGQRVGREEMLKYFKELSYFLIPYRRNQYMISASGVFWDAVNEEIPMVILDCPYTRYYNEKYDIGWQFDTTEEIITFMKKGINSKDSVWLEKQSNIKKMKKKVIEENYNKIKTLIGEK